VQQSRRPTPAEVLSVVGTLLSTSFANGGSEGDLMRVAG
jgi:hypothetical protein